MKRKTFTPEEVRVLRENPYTLKVTDKTIAFIKETVLHSCPGLSEITMKEPLSLVIIMIQKPMG